MELVGNCNKHGLPTRKIQKCIINDAKDISAYVDKAVIGITSIYMAKDDLLRETADIEEDPKISGTLEVHIYIVIRKFNNECVCKLEFYELASDRETFFISSGTGKKVTQKCVVMIFSLCLIVPRYVSTVEGPTKKHGRMARLVLYVTSGFTNLVSL